MDPIESVRLLELERENQALRSAVSLLHQINKLTRESLELEATCFAVLTGVTAGVGLGLNRAILWLVDEEEHGVLRGHAAVGPADGDEADRVWRAIEAEAPDLETLYEAGRRMQGNDGALQRLVHGRRIAVTTECPPSLALRLGRTVLAEGSDDLDGLLHLPTAIAAPMRGREKVRGVLYADNRFTCRALDPVTMLVFSLVADQAGRAIDAAYRYEQVAHEARTDSLTGLGHHGAMMEATIAAVAEARATDADLGVAMLDLDDFKAVNDTLGHLVGDALLAAVAGRLQASVRAGETPFRYGGEEFLVLLPRVGPAALRMAGERLRAAVAGRPFQLGKDHSQSVTCSVGLAALGRGTADAHGLIAAADRALRRAKSSGKNRVQEEPAD